jgi:putative tributyrin esterase
MPNQTAPGDRTMDPLQPDSDPGLKSPRAVSAPLELTEQRYYSRALGKTQTYGLYGPPAADHGSLRYPLLLLLHGRGGAWPDWGRYTRLARYLTGNDLIVVCADGDDGWYTNAVDGGERREDDLMQDLLPILESTLPLLSWPARAIAGISMGGYGAIKLALKHPGQFSMAVSHSGGLGAPGRPDPHPVFGDPVRHASFRRAESLTWLAEQALSRLQPVRPSLVLDCGSMDPLVGESRAFSDHLNFIGYGHVYRETRGHHTWPYWDRAFRTALPEILRAVGETRVPDTSGADSGEKAGTNER